MANMIVHDIRTPLGTILAFIELLHMRNGVIPKYLKYVEKIQNQVHKLNSFVNDLLILAKTESEQAFLYSRNLSLNYPVLFLRWHPKSLR